MPEIELLINKADPENASRLLGFATPETVTEVLRFHRSIPGYKPTPLFDLADLAGKLGVLKILIKDESQRFGLNAFKALGASYAAVKTMDLDSFIPQSKPETLVTATDGNHGRAVAWVAQQLGCDSVVFIPEGANPDRVEAIKTHGADVRVGGINYEAAIERAIEASRNPDHTLMQDTARDGYEQIPELITQGYFSLVSESIDQIAGGWPTHVFIQGGVGSLAAGVIGAFHAYHDRPIPKFVIVEPMGAACIFESAKRGSLYTIEGKHETIMACLSCGRASTAAFELLIKAADVFVSCDDEVSRTGMRVLANPAGGDPRIDSGESGAVTTGLLYEVMGNPDHAEIRSSIGLGPESAVLLFSTEGSTDSLG